MGQAQAIQVGADRGRIAEGAAADLVVFDAQRVTDTATYEEPKRAATGIEVVLVHGVPVWQQGRSTGARPGRVLTRQGAGDSAKGS